KINSSFTNLTSPSITAGTASANLAGRVSSYTAASGTVTATINGVTSAPAFVNGNANNFSIPFNTQTLAAGTYPVTYTYSGDSNSNGTTDNSTALTVVAAPVISSFSASPSTVLSGNS